MKIRIKRTGLLLLLTALLLLSLSVNAFADPIKKPFKVSVKGLRSGESAYMIIPDGGVHKAVLFAQGYGVRASQTIDSLKYFSSKGYVAMAVDYTDVANLVEAVKFLKKHQNVRASEVNIVGFSLGARYAIFTCENLKVNSVVAIGGRYIVGSEVLPEPEHSPITYVKKVSCPILLLHSRNDPVVPSKNSLAMKQALEKAGKRVKIKIYNSNSHWPGGNYPLKDAVRFMESPGSF